MKLRHVLVGGVTRSIHLCMHLRKCACIHHWYFLNVSVNLCMHASTYRLIFVGVCICAYSAVCLSSSASTGAPLDGVGSVSDNKLRQALIGVIRHIYHAAVVVAHPCRIRPRQAWSSVGPPSTLSNCCPSLSCTVRKPAPCQTSVVLVGCCAAP